MKLFLAILIGTMVVCADAQKPRFDLDRTLAKCCSKESWDCCTEAIILQRPLQCPMPEDELRSSANCIQVEINGGSSAQLVALEDDQCCNILHQMQNDDGKWASLCRRTVALPSTSGRSKLLKIKDAAPNLETYTCFRKCQLHRRMSTTEFPISKCNLFKMMKPGFFYVGRETHQYEQHASA